MEPTYAMFLQILTEAEARVEHASDPRVKANSAETVALCEERMRREGMTRKQLRVLART